MLKHVQQTHKLIRAILIDKCPPRSSFWRARSTSEPFIIFPHSTTRSAKRPKDLKLFIFPNLND